MKKQVADCRITADCIHWQRLMVREAMSKFFQIVSAGLPKSQSMSTYSMNIMEQGVERCVGNGR